MAPETRSHLPGLALAGAAIAFLLPRLSQADGLPIRGYGVMLLLALVASIGLAAWRAERLGLDPDMILSLAFWLVTSGILGARAFYIIEYWQQFQRPTLAETLASMINVSQGGLVVYGSLLAGGAALTAFVLRYRVPGLALSDLVAPSVVLGVAVGRLGCFLNGCCYGGTSDLPWSVSFPWGSPPHAVQVERGPIADSRHPLRGQRLRSADHRQRRARLSGRPGRSGRRSARDPDQRTADRYGRRRRAAADRLEQIFLAPVGRPLVSRLASEVGPNGCRGFGK